MKGNLLLYGDCLERLDEIPDKSADMVLTDPPYSSGGLYTGARKKSTGEKYTSREYNGAARFPDFDGDNMDQRSFTEFMRMALSKCRRKTADGGICAVFIDWRNLPAMTDAMQAAGWIYSGIVPWDKGNSRATPWRFRNDCEYVVWGTNGKRDAAYRKGVEVYPGCYHVPAVPSRRKHHQTEKPLELLEALLRVCPEGGTVLDPFAGSGSTGVACMRTGRGFVGIESGREYFDVMRERMEDENAG